MFGVDLRVGERPAAATPDDTKPGAQASGKNRAAPEAAEKARTEWEGARATVESELDDLMDAMSDVMETDATEAAMAEARGMLDDIIGKFDKRLSKKLDKIAKATDEQTREDLLGDARTIVADYVKDLELDPRIKKLEGSTPFGISLSVHSTLKGALQNIGALLA